MSTIHPGNFQPSSGTSVSRTTVRSAARCAAIWVAGLFIAVPAIIGTLFGILGRITGSMAIVAGISLFIAGRIAEKDRQGNKVPSDDASPGGERDLGCFFSLAVLLLIAAAIGGLISSPPQQ